MPKKIKKILIPTDYSANAKRAIGFGLQLAEKLQAEVLLFHAFHFPMTTSEDMVYISKMKEGEDERMEKERFSLQVKHPKLKLSCLVEYGLAVDLISTISEREAIDLIIMGTKGETNGIDAVLGSVASNTIGRVTCGVLVIPEETRELNIEDVVLATDFHDTRVLSVYWPLIEILNETDASLAIVNVKQEIDLEEIPSKTEIATENIFSDYKHSYHFIEGENVEEALFDFSNVHEADLIVIVTKHYNLWERLWHRSMAKKLALHSTIPLLILNEST